MSEVKQQYTEAIRQHLAESFPNADSLPHTVNLIFSDWVSAISEKCPAPDGMDKADADIAIRETLSSWLIEHGHEPVGEIWVNSKRREDEAKAKAEAEARKRAAETAPLHALIKNSVMECLIECGLVEMKPQVRKPIKKTKPAIKGHRH